MRVALARLIIATAMFASSIVRADSAASGGASADAKSPGVAAALSVPPTVLGLGLVGSGLYIANLDPSCTGDPMTGSRTCHDYFPLGLNLTIAGGVLLAVGPSLGHIYNRRAWTTGLKVRLIGTGISALGLAVAAFGPGDCGEIVCPAQGIGLLVMIGGGATFVVGAGIDAVRAHAAVEQRNAQLTVSRLHTPSGSAPALVLTTTF